MKTKTSPIPRVGTCYKDAYFMLKELQETAYGTWFLAQGVAIGTGPHNKGKPFGHAWLESVDTRYVMSIKKGEPQILPRAVYYLLGQIRSVELFTFAEAHQKALVTGKFGPWNPAIKKAEVWIEAGKP